MTKLIPPFISFLIIVLIALILITSTNAKEESPIGIFLYTTIEQADGTILNIEIFTIDPVMIKEHNNIDYYVLAGFKHHTMPMIFKYNPQGKIGLETYTNTIASSVTDGWNNISLNLSLNYGGASSKLVSSSLCSGSPPDGENTIGWGPQAGFSIAMACWWTGADECDIMMEPSRDYPNPLDLRAILFHELGHCLGLGHSYETGSIMHPIYSGLIQKPGTDDTNAICFLYLGCSEVTQTPQTSTVVVFPTFTPNASVAPSESPTARFTSTSTIVFRTPTPFPTIMPTPTLIKICGFRFDGYCIRGLVIAKD